MKQFWIILIVVIVSAGIFGGGTYYLVNSQAQNDKDSLNSQISSLNKQISSLNKTVATDKSQIAAQSQSPSSTSTTLSSYTNASNKYTLKYPTSYTVYSCDNTSTCGTGTLAQATTASNSILIQPTTISAPATDDFTLTVGAQNTTLDSAYASSYLEKMFSVSQDVLGTPTATTVGGVSGYKVHGLTGDGEDFYIISHDNQIYVLCAVTSITTSAQDITNILNSVTFTG